MKNPPVLRLALAALLLILVAVGARARTAASLAPNRHDPVFRRFNRRRASLLRLHRLDVRRRDVDAGQKVCGFDGHDAESVCHHAELARDDDFRNLAGTHMLRVFARQPGRRGALDAGSGLRQQRDQLQYAHRGDHARIGRRRLSPGNGQAPRRTARASAGFNEAGTDQSRKCKLPTMRVRRRTASMRPRLISLGNRIPRKVFSFQ